MTHAERGHVIASQLRVLRGLGVTGALAIALVSASAASGVAYASCAGTPATSPYGFTGTVIRLGADDRQAFIQKDDGTQVEVDGGTIGGGFSGEDFDFVLGGAIQNRARKLQAALSGQRLHRDDALGSDVGEPVAGSRCIGPGAVAVRCARDCRTDGFSDLGSASRFRNGRHLHRHLLALAGLHIRRARAAPSAASMGLKRTSVGRGSVET